MTAQKTNQLLNRKDYRFKIFRNDQVKRDYKVNV